ncbi:hypothetical protein [Streptococcus pyogenes]|uniref:hypothetical protein n=1 Tax=Streptococcus pyogenes TaxID=1314 RepID=UPI00129372F9|nr:hypothetical protein [Streptococcus pyogenes]
METIQNSIALKQTQEEYQAGVGFETIQNSIALKPTVVNGVVRLCFGTIQNSIALKPRRLFLSKKFRNRTICLS